jgi:hypothetical protein
MQTDGDYEAFPKPPKKKKVKRPKTQENKTNMSMNSTQNNFGYNYPTYSPPNLRRRRFKKHL